ncbi:hypothetical protein Peur_055115 [Populus x canadensis]
MDITGTDLAVSILFTFQSLILAELGLKLGVKSAFVLCIFHILLARKSKPISLFAPPDSVWIVDQVNPDIRGHRKGSNIARKIDKAT